VLKPEL